MHMFRRVFFVSAPLAAFAGGMAMANKKNVSSLADNTKGISKNTKNVPVPQPPVAFHSPFSTGEKQLWDHNWDKRDPFSMIDQNVYEAADEELKKEMIAKLTPSATRNIFLIRHGQYNSDSDIKELTALGREQADLMGKRFAEFEVGKGKKINKCVVSTMQRAKETADIALKHLPHAEEIRKNTDLLEEGAPCSPEPEYKAWRPLKYYFADGARIEAAFRKYFHRASPSQKEDTYELFICHANVIRYFVCRALQFPPEGWLRISLVNSSITWIQIRPNGCLSLLALGDAGHLTPEKATFA